MMPESEERLLAPCPFCGGQAEIAKGETNLIGCKNQFCHGFIYDAPKAINPIEAIKAWNTRQPREIDEEKLIYFLGATFAYPCLPKKEEVEMLAKAICSYYREGKLFKEPEDAGE